MTKNIETISITDLATVSGGFCDNGETNKVCQGYRLKQEGLAEMGQLTSAASATARTNYLEDAATTAAAKAAEKAKGSWWNNIWASRSGEKAGAAAAQDYLSK